VEKRARRQVVAMPPPPPPPLPLSAKWRVAVNRPASDDDKAGYGYDTETAARQAAKLVGGGSLYIVRPDGTSYPYFKQPWE
jgi:hypothetical protein